VRGGVGRGGVGVHLPCVLLHGQKAIGRRLLRADACAGGSPGGQSTTVVGRVGPAEGQAFGASPQGRMHPGDGFVEGLVPAWGWIR